MENHPIPQDITGFQFKLIGEMTVKQFAYVATGVFVAWLFYLSPLISVIKFPLMLIFGAFGAALAFLPIDGRPMDTMIKNFFKAVFAPTQYIYQKTGGQLLSDSPSLKKGPVSAETAESQFKNFINTLPTGKNKLDKKEMIFFQSISQYGSQAPQAVSPGYVAPHAFATQAPVNQPAPAPQAPSQKLPEDVNASIENTNLQKTAALLEKELQEAKAKEAAAPQADSKEYLSAHQKVLELQKNLNDLLSQKQQLETRVISLQKQLENQGKPVYSPSMMAQGEAPQETKFVRSVPQNMAKSVGLPITPEFPNIITGIVKDPRGNPLANILVEVKDNQANAVRAFKTNALGQFASATPLNNGDFTIEFEDPRGQNKFDKIGFKAVGEIILPIEIISVDTREELRRSLFN